MRGILLLLLGACSFSPPAASTGDDSAPSSDARPIDARPIDARPIDARPIDAPAPHDCGNNYQTVSNLTSKYRKINVGTLWVAAEVLCEGDGAHLVIPETTAEAVAVFQFVDPSSNSPFYWAGIQNLNQDATWTTVKNQTFANPPWAATTPPQPNLRPGEVYVLVGSDGKFYDFFNNAVQEFACECEP